MGVCRRRRLVIAQIIQYTTLLWSCWYEFKTYLVLTLLIDMYADGGGAARPPPPDFGF